VILSIATNLSCPFPSSHGFCNTFTKVLIDVEILERKDDSQLNRNDTRFVLEEKQAKSNPASVKAKAKGTYVSHWEQELTDSV